MTEDTGDVTVVSTPEQSGRWLLPPVRPEHKGRKCLVLDLDETLVHSSFKVSMSRIVSQDFLADGLGRFYTKQTLRYQ